MLRVINVDYQHPSIGSMIVFVSLRWNFKTTSIWELCSLYL